MRMPGEGCGESQRRSTSDQNATSATLPFTRVGWRELKTSAISAWALFVATACTGTLLEEKPSLVSPEPVQSRSMSCLAMSGGGIRSGAVSLGALQELYAANQQLSQYEFISTVSGGGYPVYGILDRILRGGRTLSDLLPETSDFIADVDKQSKFITKTDIYTGAVLGAVLWAPLSWLPNDYGGAVPTYEAEIHQTFTGGHWIPLFGTVMLEKAKDIRSKGFPTPIFAASVNKGAHAPHAHQPPYGFNDVFELSPTYSGSQKTGYFYSVSKKTDLAAAEAASASAIDTPTGYIRIPDGLKDLNFGLGVRFHAPRSDAEYKDFNLEDGGFADNLGLVPLLRRGCTDILVFDNSADQRPFESWYAFVDKLAGAGWRIPVPLHAAPGVELPPSIPKTTTDDKVPPEVLHFWRWDLPDHIWDARLEVNGHDVHVRLVKLGLMSRKKWGAYSEPVGDFLNKNYAEKTLQCSGGGLHQTCSFPLEATARQSYETSEFQAYRHLGQWLAQQALSRAPQ